MKKKSSIITQAKDPMRSLHWSGLDYWHPDPGFKLIIKVFYQFYRQLKKWLMGFLYQWYILQQGCEALDLWEVELWRVHGGLRVNCTGAGHGQRATHSPMTLKPRTLFVSAACGLGSGQDQSTTDIGISQQGFRPTIFYVQILILKAIDRSLHWCLYCVTNWCTG